MANQLANEPAADLPISDICVSKKLKLALNAARMSAYERNIRTGIVTKSFVPVSSHDDVANTRNHFFNSNNVLTSMSYEDSMLLLHPEDRLRVHEQVDRAIKDGSEFQLIFRKLNPEGEMGWFQSNGRAFYDENGRPTYVYAVSQDITEKKNAEEALRKKTEELSLVNKKLERFSAVVAHDLKGPLSSMTMSADLIEQAENLAEAKEYLSYIKAGAQRMASLVDDLLTFAKLGDEQSIAKENVPLKNIIATVQANLKSALTTSKALLVIGGEDVQVLGHAGQLTQVFQNLIANSLKFTAGDIPIIKVSFTEKPEAWLVKVQDNGIGMTPEALNALFQPFKRFHASQFEGTGLGLSIVKKIIERHDGKIWVESQPGHGSVFYFTLPKANEVAEQHWIGQSI